MGDIDYRVLPQLGKGHLWADVENDPEKQRRITIAAHSQEELERYTKSFLNPNLKNLKGDQSTPETFDGSY